MPPYFEVFLSPIMDERAQVAIVALCMLALLDVGFGVINAWFFQQNFSSHEFRAGLLRKLANLGMVVVAVVIDGMLLGGLNLGWQPVLMTVVVSLALMELASLMEIYAQIHPEITEAPWYQMLAHGKENSGKGSNNG